MSTLPSGVAPERTIGPFQLLALGVNGIVGVGIFFAPAEVAAQAPGLGAVWAFALTGLALVPVAFAFAVLGRRFDSDGGPVVFARAAFGERVSFLVGWVAYVSAFLSTSAVMAGLARAVAPSVGLGGPVGERLLASALVTGLAALVASGIRVSARTWTALTVLKLVPLAVLLGAFFFLPDRDVPPPLPATGASWLKAGLTVMFAYQGFEIVPVIAGQVRASERTVPMATVGSLLLAMLLYVGLVWACVAALPDLASASAPLAQAAGVWSGAGMERLVGAGTSVSALGICVGMMVTTPRYLSALASGERSLFGLERMSESGVPMRALAVTWALVLGFVNLGDLSELFALSAIAVLMQFGVTAAALAVLSLRRERNLRPVHALLAVPTLVLGLTLVAFGASAREAAVASVAVLAGLALMRLSRPREPAPVRLP
ncbi:amino acid permease [Corallococcus coralloides DSM 2259]|uniref:Arginine/agmatine antiporter n=1 Tax=Corallococcus coralloides (strain ATCC 25202 / DSM 2259 / NBRC 100086 / M2) TaxID=1144275 RepID=H8MFN9_CORCM|nr:APC family permease [Corallococcus coralloides]AFE08820.1 amino acid permease [Corallococcus coralloides DSM 2259]